MEATGFEPITNANGAALHLELCFQIVGFWRTSARRTFIGSDFLHSGTLVRTSQTQMVSQHSDGDEIRFHDLLDFFHPEIAAAFITSTFFERPINTFFLTNIFWTHTKPSVFKS